VHARNRAICAAVDQLTADTRSSHHFDPELDEQLEEPTRTLEVWLAHTEPLVQHGLAEAAHAIATGHLDVRDCFTNTATLNMDPPSSPD
jgi:hypothetical protein